MPMRTRKPFEDRFWSMVNKTDTCWLWTGHTGKRRYGYIFKDGKYLRSNRVSYEMHFMPIPEGMVVCHTCDEPRCVNPEHLFLGSHTDNMRDMVRKGRHASQVGINSRARLTPQQVQEIRMTDRTLPSHIVAPMYGVSSSTIRRIRSGHSWATLNSDAQ